MNQFGRKQIFTILLAVGVLISLTIVATSYGSRPVAVVDKSVVDEQAQIQRGQYLVTIGGCNDCHTPWIMGPKGPEPDMTRALSGHPQQFAIDKPARIESDQWAWSGAPTNTAFSSASRPT